MTLPTQLKPNPAYRKPVDRVFKSNPPTTGGRTGATIDWTPVRQRVARRVQARGDKTLLTRFMQKWSREDAAA